MFIRMSDIGEPAVTQIYMHPREAIRKLVAEGVVHGLSDEKLDELRAECWDGSEEQLEDAGLLGILSFFYETVDRGVRDGFVWHAEEFWNDSDDAVGELAAALGGEKPLYRMVDSRLSNGRLHIEMERDDGTRKHVEAETLADLADAFNDELAARKSNKRLVELDTSGDWQMFIAIDKALGQRLAVEGALPVLDPDSLSD
jgi:hypothetical protein